MKNIILLFISMFSLTLTWSQDVKPKADLPASRLKNFNKALLSSTSFQQHLNKSMNTVNFVPNKGQYNREVLYTFITPQAQMIVFADRLRMVSLKRETNEKQTIDITFPGSNSLRPLPLAKKDAPTFNFFSGEGNTTDVAAAGELQFPNVYKGVTLRLYSNSAGSLEFDWLTDNAEAGRKIKMKFNGQDYLRTDKEGSLVVGLRFGELKFKIPETYQVTRNGEKIVCSSSFKVTNHNTASYAVKLKQNKSLPLVIDPVLIWGSFMEGNSANFDAYLFSGVRDANGDIYVAGGSNRITGTDLSGYGSPAATGYATTPPSGTATTSNNGADWLIMKIKNDGSAVLIYTFFGLASTNNATREQAHCIDISPNGGTIFVGGICDASGVSLSLPALSAGFTGNTAFGGTTSSTTWSNPNGIPTIAAFSANLSSLKYRSFIGSGTVLGDVSSIEALNDNDYILAANVNANLGNGAGAVNYASAGLDQTYNAGLEVYIGKFTNFNTRSWGTYVGGDGNDQVDDMRRLSNGDVVFVGSAASTNASMTTLSNEVASTANRNNTTATSDGIVGVITANGSGFSMLSKVGGGSNDEITGIETGNCDTVYVVGETFSNNFPNIGAGVLQTAADANVGSAAAGVGGNGTGTSNNGGDMILGKFSAYGGTTGTVFSYYGGNGTDIANSIGYIPLGLGTLFVFGSTTSNSGMNTVNNLTGNSFYQSAFQGAWDMFFIECTPDLKTKKLATYCGGSGSDYLGNTGDQITGKQMRILSDSSIGIFTTSHSGTFTPNVIASGFDVARTNPTGGATDAWVMFSLNVGDAQGAVDLGDAPASYGKGSVLIDVSGANTTLSIGNKVDDDKYYPQTPGTAADFDNNEGSGFSRKTGTNMYYDIGAAGSATVSDEDGVAGSIAISTVAASYNLTVPFYNNSGSTATLYGYIDFNKDGDFNDANESTSVTSLPSNANAAGTAGRTASLTWTVPGGTTSGSSYLRLVLVKGTGSAVLTGCNGGLSYVKNQALGSGEIEDYPVTLSSTLSARIISFTGKLVQHVTELNWQTANEDNVSHFEIEKSSNGVSFTAIGTKQAVGFGSSAYTFNDPAPFDGNTYYRLRIVDNDGHFYYSTIIRIKNTSSSDIEFSIWPNPASSILNINTTSAKPGMVTVYDAAGAKKMSAEIKYNAGSINIESLSPGIYVAQFQSGGTVITKKFVRN